MPTEPDDTGHDGPGLGDGHPGVELWGDLIAVAEKIAGATHWSMSDSQSRAAVAAGVQALAIVESALLAQILDLDTRSEAVSGARPGQVARTYLMHALHRSGGQAGADVRAARALDPGRSAPEGGLPELGAAFAAGLISRRHVDVAEQIMSRLPSGPAKAVDPDDPQGRTGAERVEAFLAEQAQILDPDALARLGRDLLARLDPGRDEAGYDAEAYRRRYLSMAMAPDGMLVGRFALPAAQAAVVRAAIEAFSAPQAAGEQPDENGQPVLISDERSRGQRMADAFTALARAGLAAQAAGGGEPAHVTLITDLDPLAAARTLTEDPAATSTATSTATSATAPPDGAGARKAAGLAHCIGHGPISSAALATLACDARLRAVVLDQHGAVLHLGRSQRLASKAQRTALAARDRGCVIAGCTASASICDVHHVTWWSHGGPTDIDTMALVCPRHHTDIHHGVWRLRMRDGVPWARPPAWAALRLRSGTDEHGHWVRNSVHHTMDTSRRLGQQLRLDLDDG